MSKPKSAGILVYRRVLSSAEFLLAHPGGPFWKNKDTGSWSVPKGLIDEGEQSFAAAAREFEEEVGQRVSGNAVELTPLKQKSGKTIYCWLIEADLDLSSFVSNMFEMEWPRGSGNLESFPEIDQVAYLKPQLACLKILQGQKPFIEEAIRLLNLSSGESAQTSPVQGLLF